MPVRKTMIAPEGEPALSPEVPTHPPGERKEVDGLPAGTIVNGRYAIERVLGYGGMATVYLARHIEIGAPLAIKVLHDSLCEIPTAAEHFLNEARGMSRIQHPHVVAVNDYGKLESGAPFMVMEYINGEDLETVLVREGPLPWARVRGIARQICEALGAAHLQGVVHRDVKPHNCLRQAHTQFGDFIKVLDFGIAQVGEDAQRSGSRWAKQPRSIVGTPEYMAPEVGRGAEVDHRADVYSLGVALFSLLTGRLPFLGRDPWEQIDQHQAVEPPRPSDVAPPHVVLDPRLDDVILRAMAKKPSDRYPSMAAFAEALDAVPIRPSLAIEDALEPHALPIRGAAHPRPRSHAAWRAAGVAAIGVVVLGLVVAQWNDDRETPPAAATGSVSATVAAPPAVEPVQIPVPFVIPPPPPPPLPVVMPPEAGETTGMPTNETGPASPRGSANGRRSSSSRPKTPRTRTKTPYTGPLRNPYQ